LCGGKGAAVIAFDQKTGEVRWKKHDYQNSYSTPKLISIDGHDELVCFMAVQAIGIDARTGELEWEVPHKNQWKQNITLPIWSPEDHLLFIVAEGDGAKGLRLTRENGETRMEQVWENKKVKVHHTNAVRVGDYVYTSMGSMGPSFFASVSLKTGEIAWKERGFAKANSVYADGKFYILDENGNLGMATCSPEGFEIKTQYPILKKTAWTVPTLAGKVLYLRDQKKIIALDVG